MTKEKKSVLNLRIWSWENVNQWNVTTLKMQIWGKLFFEVNVTKCLMGPINFIIKFLIKTKWIKFTIQKNSDQYGKAKNQQCCYNKIYFTIFLIFEASEHHIMISVRSLSHEITTDVIIIIHQLSPLTLLLLLYTNYNFLSQ